MEERVVLDLVVFPSRSKPIVHFPGEEGLDEEAPAEGERLHATPRVAHTGGPMFDGNGQQS